MVKTGQFDHGRRRSGGLEAARALAAVIARPLQRATQFEARIRRRGCLAKPERVGENRNGSVPSALRTLGDVVQERSRDEVRIRHATTQEPAGTFDRMEDVARMLGSEEVVELRREVFAGEGIVAHFGPPARRCELGKPTQHQVMSNRTMGRTRWFKRKPIGLNPGAMKPTTKEVIRIPWPHGASFSNSAAAF